MSRAYVCPPNYVDEDLLNKSLLVCGPVFRDVLDCWQKKSTKHAMEAIKKAANSLDLNNYRCHSLEERIANSNLTNLSLLLPNTGDRRSMTFSRLSQYAEDMLLDKISRFPSEEMDRVMADLKYMPEVGSLEGLMWREFGHQYVSSIDAPDFSFYLPGDSYCDHDFPACTVALPGILHPERFFEMLDTLQKDIQMATNNKDRLLTIRLSHGYYRFGKQAPADGIAIIRDQDEHGSFPRVVLFQYTIPDDSDQRATAAGLNALKDRLIEAGLQKLLPQDCKSNSRRYVESDNSAIRRDWIFVWVVPSSEPNMSFKPKVFSTSVEDKWMDSHIEQYKHVTSGCAFIKVSNSYKCQ
jgi:hypothetical protein